jgi:enamine deaminase RidA (YjgF/YER057c/UK114 family)
MSDVKHLAPTRIAGTDIVFAQGVRAGPWLFFTGHEATDFENGLAPEVAGKPGLPLGGGPRYRREGDYIIGRFARLIEAEGGDLRHIVRVDQFYPSAASVNGYQRARKAKLGNYVPPSTSVLMEELLVEGSTMNVSMVAVLPEAGSPPHPAERESVPVPPHSGFIPSLVWGDYVFVAGQMVNTLDMTSVEPAAFRHPKALWNGTDIRLQTEYLITSRLKPALEAGGSSLRNAIKAQVYLTNIQDLPEFMDVWNSHFGDNPCALTVVATSGLAQTDCIIEVNIFGLRDDAATKKEIVEHQASDAMRLGPAAVRAGDLLCLSALFAADSEGALPAVRRTAAFRHLGISARVQADTILKTAAEICKAGGTSLENVLRATHFVGDLDVVHPTIAAWQAMIPGVPLPFGAVRTPAPMPVPGCDVILDMWAYRP